ncbi:hypothetical protein Pla52n_09320 [Stieleria varia]|uniref:Uncharacterized protein n=1 Tax=Stieleria varia TaxID=2528005 RepID=A0A5C6B8R2_9BACT|nr:hypothetical protein Pla52n_09320 [Stieleria varia]
MNLGTHIRFCQSCPTCGRRVQIRASLLGTQVACRHCHATFTASAFEDEPGAVDDAKRLMDRVEQMLVRAELDAPMTSETTCA